MRQAIELALADLAEHGVTSAQDYSPAWENFQIYEELEKEGKLTARISEWLPFDEPVEDLDEKARFASAVRSDASHRHAQGLYGRLPRVAHRGDARAIRG